MHSNEVEAAFGNCDYVVVAAEAHTLAVQSMCGVLWLASYKHSPNQLFKWLVREAWSFFPARFVSSNFIQMELLKQNRRVHPRLRCSWEGSHFLGRCETTLNLFEGGEGTESRFFCILDTENGLSGEVLGFWHCDVFTVTLLLSYSGILKNTTWFGPFRYDGWQHILQQGSWGWSVRPRLYPKATAWCWQHLTNFLHGASLRIAKDKEFGGM